MAEKTRRWRSPKLRGDDYSKERKAKVHMHGPKKDQPLTDYEAGLRSGYLQSQSDNAGMYKYKKAMQEGKTKAEAKAISRRVGK